jgi:DNA-binding XRE family transcriptional regulator
MGSGESPKPLRSRRSAAEASALRFVNGRAVRVLLPFARPRCPGCRELMRAARVEWIPQRAPDLGPLWTFLCGARRTRNCLGGGWHFDRAGHRVSIPRPTPVIPSSRRCQCGARVIPVTKFWFHKRLKKRVRRVRCPLYRKATKDKHRHEVLDERDRVVKLSFRPLDPGWRPMCGDWVGRQGDRPLGCGQLLVKGSNSISQAKVDTYYCNKRDCPLQWRSFHWHRRPRRPYEVDRQYRLHRETRQGTRPTCCGSPMYVRRTHIDRGLRAFICRDCRKVRYWNANNESVMVPRASFRRRVDMRQRPRCRTCGHELTVVHTSVRKYPPTRVHFLACRRQSCPNDESARPYDSEGRLALATRLQLLPWEKTSRDRVRCAVCGASMYRGGTFLQRDTQQQVHEFRCVSESCAGRSSGARRRYFDQTGAERVPPFGGPLIRIHRNRRLSERARLEPCGYPQCPQPRYSNQYCKDHAKQPNVYVRVSRLKAKQAALDKLVIGGPTLKTMRQRLGKTQEDLAAAIGVSRSRIGQWESNAQRPRRMTAQRLKDYFKQLF